MIIEIINEIINNVRLEVILEVTEQEGLVFIKTSINKEFLDYIGHPEYVTYVADEEISSGWGIEDGTYMCNELVVLREDGFDELIMTLEEINDLKEWAKKVIV